MGKEKTGGGQTLWSVALFVVSVLGMLAAVAAVSPSEPLVVGAVTLRMPDLAEALSGSGRDTLSVETRLTAVEEEMKLPVVDSAALALADSVRLYEEVLMRGEASLSYPDGDMTFLFPFFRAALAADTSVVNVVHYGDSQIEGDRITGLLRDSLQQLFGGSGPGLLPLWQPIPARSVGQTLSDSVPSFYAGGMMGRRAGHGRYGAMAQMAQMSGQSVVFGVTARKSGNFRHVRLFAGHGPCRLTATVGGDVQKATGDAILQQLHWELEPARQSVSMSLEGSGEVYGIAIDGGSGVSVSNIPMRGSDGTFFSRMEPRLLGKMLQEINARLIIMEFGGNALPVLNDSARVVRYANSFAKQIKAIAAACPEARVLVIGPADMSVKVKGELQTHPYLDLLVREMRRASTEAGAAFWDMYSVMGGRNSMLAWVNHKPSWAAADYVHFTPKGANRIAAVLWNTLAMNYQYMLLRERQRALDERVATEGQQEAGDQ